MIGRYIISKEMKDKLKTGIEYSELFEEPSIKTIGKNEVLAVFRTKTKNFSIQMWNVGSREKYFMKIEFYI